jgi:hypothetical protein
MAGRHHEHAIQCGVTRVPRVYVKPNRGKMLTGGIVYVGGLQIGDVYKSPIGTHKGKWVASNDINKRVKPSEHRTAVAAVKALVCGQVRSERSSRGQSY